jgi:hypothetical protein
VRSDASPNSDATNERSHPKHFANWLQVGYLMGLDVHGGVEVTHFHNGDPWFDVVDIGWMVNRSKHALYLLWGHNPCGRQVEFEPIADSRGLPDDVATALRQEFEKAGKYAYGASYVTLEELRDVDWTSNASDVDSIFWRNYPDREQLGTPIHDIDSLDLSPNELEELNAQGVVEYENDRGVEHVVRRAEPTRKRYCQTGGWWWVIDELMEHLVEWGNDPDKVRLVVWMQN